uniref:Uncharacterized protein n=1 Tax=Siphoviridae sp. ctRPk8 TaxID=2827870 RepID=A0A8S5SIY8_9CAUD|nr:MAG TPA: hypothetical protein [Siphoviridae sp. ctRPk8]DAO05244.1 MAG TPA: hypothetical protein [Caudoviricetes sp.]DAY49721.1 MAG TPA: hypothetical protein [Caudoviricetes sp.]
MLNYVCKTIIAHFLSSCQERGGNSLKIFYATL